MPTFHKIRQSIWHESAAHLRKFVDVPQCSCKPKSAGGDSCSTDLCHNRSCLIECVGSNCACGDECENQRMQKPRLPKARVQKFPGSKGMGAVAEEDIPASVLVAEYVGEVINQAELSRRMQGSYRDMRHTYIMQYGKGLMVDATAKGGFARYLNHSCDPNCETQYWVIKGETRIGIFTKVPIKAGTELTYDYNLQWDGFARVRCECGTAKCSGWLGGRSAGKHAQLSLIDSEDEAAEGAVYLDEGAEGATKVSQLSTHSTLPAATVSLGTARTRKRECASVMAEPLPYERVSRDLQGFIQAATKYHCAHDIRASVEMSDQLRKELDEHHQKIEEKWKQHQEVVCKLLMGMQEIGRVGAK